MSFLVENVYSSESAEWYTPGEYIALVRAVLGGIDLDPASCELANKTVKATRYFSREDDGLNREWVADRLWCNPPYGRVGESRQIGQTELWIEHLLQQYHAGNTKEAILLVNASLYKQWFASLWQFPICFPAGRIAFISPSGKHGRSPHASAFVYLGPNKAKFAATFDAIGPVVERIPVVQDMQPGLWDSVA